MVDGNPSIEVLPDEVLLQIFSLCNPRGHADKHMPPVMWGWYRLAHVCQRWRRIVFAFPRYLGLILVTGWRRCVGALDCWPAFPIAIQHKKYEALRHEAEDDILAGLKHPDRIYEINLPVSYRLLEKSATLAWSFPQLERLDILSARGHYIDLPRGFLGGLTPTSHKLRYIKLMKITFPSLPQLLFSNRNLLHLSLGRGVSMGEGYIPSDTLASSLSAATQLEYLLLQPGSTMPNPEQRSTRSASLSPNLIVLPSLVDIVFQGSKEYLEDLISRIHAPRLRRSTVEISQIGAQPFDLSQLGQFISRSECLRLLPFQTSIVIGQQMFEIVHDFGPSPPWGSISLKLYPARESWDVSLSQVIHLSGQLSPLMSCVERLIIYANKMPPSPRDESDTVRWLRLFMPFNNAQDVELCNVYQVDDAIANALYESTEMGQEVFPALRILRLCDFGTKTSPAPGIKSFVDERRRTGKTVTVVRRYTWLHDGGSDVESVN